MLTNIISLKEHYKYYLITVIEFFSFIIWILKEQFKNSVMCYEINYFFGLCFLFFSKSCKTYKILF